jgi:hypothetical protein
MPFWLRLTGTLAPPQDKREPAVDQRAGANRGYGSAAASPFDRFAPHATAALASKGRLMRCVRLADMTDDQPKARPALGL